MISNERPLTLSPPLATVFAAPIAAPPAGQRRHPPNPGRCRLNERPLPFCSSPRGRFLRIIGENGRHSDSIIIPSAGLEDFRKLLGEMANAAEELPPEELPQ